MKIQSHNHSKLTMVDLLIVDCGILKYKSKYTLMCLVLGYLKIINFPFVPNGKFIIFRCPKIWAHHSLIIMCLNIGTPNNHHFPLGKMEK